MADCLTPSTIGARLLPLELLSCVGSPVTVTAGPAVIVVYRGFW